MISDPAGGGRARFARVARPCCRGKAGLANLLVTAELVPLAWRAQVWRKARLLRRVSSVPHSCFRVYETVLCHTLWALCAYGVMTWCVDAA